MAAIVIPQAMEIDTRLLQWNLIHSLIFLDHPQLAAWLCYLNLNDNGVQLSSSLTFTRQDKQGVCEADWERAFHTVPGLPCHEDLGWEVCLNAVLFCVVLFCIQFLLLLLFFPVWIPVSQNSLDHPKFCIWLFSWTSGCRHGRSGQPIGAAFFSWHIGAAWVHQNENSK